MPHQDSDTVKILDKKTIYQGYAKLEIYTLQTKLFNGGFSEPYQRELLVRKDAAAVLPYDPILDKVVLIEQFRIGALQEKNPWLLEIVAGVKDQAENPEELLKRELQEEADLKALAILPIMSYFSSPGSSSEKVHLFCAQVDASQAPRFCGLAHEHEDICVHVLKTEDVFSLLHSNKLNNAATIIAVQWLEANLEKVRGTFGGASL